MACRLLRSLGSRCDCHHKKALCFWGPASELPASNAASSVAQTAGPRRPLPAKAPTLIKRTGSTRASSRSRPRGAIAAASTFAMSCNRRASSAAASPRTPTILDSPSPARWAARSVTSSLSRSAEATIGRPTAHATSVRGGGRPESTRSRLPAGSGRRRAKWDSGGLNDRHCLGRMTLPRPLTQRTSTSAPPQRRKKKLPCRMFPASRGAACWMLGDRDDVET
jgi:hypothetical protein